MINTMNTNSIVTTNVRTPQDDYIQYKMMADEMGMSFNAYYNWVMRKVSNIVQLGGDITDIKKKKQLDLRDLAKEARKIKSVPEYDDFSEDDKIVYG